MKKTLLLLSTIISIGTTAQIPTNGMMAGYPFDGNANDVSGNNWNGTVVGATLTTSRAGTANAAYHFNGTSDYIQVLGSSSLTPADYITMCAEVKVEGFYTGTCQNNTIISKNETSLNSGFYFLGFSDNPYDNDNCSAVSTSHESFFVNMKTDLTTSGAQDYTPYIVTNQWYCVVATFDGSDARLYVDGTLKVTVHAPLALGSNLADLCFGHNLNASLPYWFKGVIDDIRIYDRVLTNAEIQNYCTALVGVDDGYSIASHVTINTLDENTYELLFDKNYRQVQVTISSILGQNVYSGSGRNITGQLLNLNAFASGVYVLNVVTEEGVYSTKLVKK
jgi:hypothetical protein